MLSNIARIIRNISLIIYYKSMDISNVIVDYIRGWIVDYRKSLRYIDNPRYIYQDYEDEDSYDVNDYVTYTSSPPSGEPLIKRNKWGFPKE